MLKSFFGQSLRVLPKHNSGLPYFKAYETVIYKNGANLKDYMKGEENITVLWISKVQSAFCCQNKGSDLVFT